MGAWGVGSFENDDAVDWAADLTAAKDMTPVREAFEAVEGAGTGYVEASDAAAALAAAQVVAALSAHGSETLPEGIRSWVATRPTVDRQLVERAQQVVRRIVHSSELTDLFAESESAEQWREAANSLESHLAQALADWNRKE